MRKKIFNLSEQGEMTEDGDENGGGRSEMCIFPSFVEMRFNVLIERNNI